MAVASQSRDDIFKNFCGNLQLVVDKLRENEPPRETANFSLSDFWSKLETLFKAMSFEATKLTACFISPPIPSPEECHSLLASVEMKTVALVSIYYGLPTACGVTLRKSTKHLVIDVVESIKELAERIMRAGYRNGEQFQSTGMVWASCDVIQSSAKDNRTAALKELKSTAGLVKDALEELEEAKDSNGGSGAGMAELDILVGALGGQSSDRPEDVWSEQDRAVIHPCLGLANACKACIKRVTEAIKKNGQSEEHTHVEQLDQVVELSDEISPNLDELVSSLYAPMNYTVVRANASLISEVLHKLLKCVRDSHFVTAEDTKWLDFLTMAIDHNVDQIKNITKDEAVR